MNYFTRAMKVIFTPADERGVTAIEYGLITALVAVAIITVISLVGTNLSGVFNTLATTL
jgi:pilus assembly protein Flp/PilA